MDHLTLQGYLLGLLEDEDAEVMDEAVMVNDALASLLCIVEDDLVDAYVRGRLTEEMRARFESFYLASPRRRAKVRFAAGLLRMMDR
jgi:hypothetical protein